MEERNYLNPEQVKIELVNILKEFDEWLRRENIDYSIIAGTLLGAIRHGGLIPWDDDIDVCLDRHSYNHLISIIKEKNCILTDELFVTGFELKNSYNPYLKVYTRKVKCIEEVFPGDDQIVIETNLWLDVFPIDGVPNRFAKLFDKIRSFLLELLYKKRILVNKWDRQDCSKQSIFGKIRQFVNRCVMKIVPYKLIIRGLIWFSSLFDFNKSDIVSENVWGIGLKESFPKNLMKNYIDYDFEDIKVKGMEGGKEWLKRRYGDYMQLPPEDQRDTHGIKAWY